MANVTQGEALGWMNAWSFGPKNDTAVHYSNYHEFSRPRTAGERPSRRQACQ